MKWILITALFTALLALQPAKGTEAINYADRFWTKAITRPGAMQIGYLKKLIESRPSVQRLPDQRIITGGQGVKGEYAVAFKSADSTYAMIYIPLGKKISYNAGCIKGESVKLTWFNPKNGYFSKAGIFKKSTEMSITTPSTGNEKDWVLIIDCVR